MKKAISALLAVAVCACFGAWYNPDAYQAYNDMNEAMADVTSMEMEYHGAVDVTISGQTQSVLFDASVQQVVLSETDVEMAMKINMYMAGEDPIAATMYFKDGVMYQELLGIKIASSMDLEEAVDALGVSNVEFEEAAIRNASVKEVALGRELSFELDPELVNKMISGMAATLGEEAGLVTMEGIACTIVINDDNIMETYDIVMEMSMGAFASMKYNVNGVVTGVNTVDAITFPADLASYAGAPADAPAVDGNAIITGNVAAATAVAPATEAVASDAGDAAVGAEMADEEDDGEDVAVVADEEEAA